MRIILVLLSAAWFGAVGANAQSFNIAWFTIDAGSKSTGGPYALSGSVGQPDAGKMSGGSYAVTGGFWSLIGAIQTPDAPRLSVTNSGGVVIVSWSGPANGFVLEQTSEFAPSPGATLWSQVPFPYQTNTTQVSASVALSAGNRFFRLRQVP